MKLIYKITANSTLNRKAETFATLLSLYRNCLFISNKDFKKFIEELKRAIDNLNNSYPRTIPFELYTVSKTGVSVIVQGNPDKFIATISIAPVKSVYNIDEIVPIDSYNLIYTKNER